MRWSSMLYIGDQARRKAMTVRDQIDRSDYHGPWRIIALSSREEELLVIRPASQLKADWIRERCPLIVGLAASQREAVFLVEQMVQDCVQKTGTVAIKEYFSC